jgi:hypothetical protein
VGVALCNAYSGGNERQNNIRPPTVPPRSAVTLTLGVLGAGEGLNTGLAWLYVSLRVAHSLIQAIINVVMLRFTIFIAASLVPLVMSVGAALIVY